jgi:hypothetical protein
MATTITDPKEIADLLRSIDDYRGRIVTRRALQMAPLVSLSGRGSYGKPSGRNSTLKRQNGEYRRRR